jgi:hypothetical protein
LTNPIYVINILHHQSEICGAPQDLGASYFHCLHCLLGIPFWVCDIVSSSLDCLAIHLPLLFPNQAQSHISCPHKRYNKHQRRCRRHYNNYHKRLSNKEDTRKGKQAHSTFDGWALWPHPAPHINQPLPVSQSLLNDFISTHDPSQIMEVADLFSIQGDDMHGIVSVPLTTQALISTFEAPKCFSSIAINSSLVIDSGASVCISPHKSDVITYNKSKMKIKDLSSSNHVAGEGMAGWYMKDVNDSPIQVKLMGYHMPKAEVRLLSHQVLIKTVGGQSLQTNKGIDITLDNGVNLFAHYCLHSNLPLILLAIPKEERHCFWSTKFGFSASDFK